MCPPEPPNKRERRKAPVGIFSLPPAYQFYHLGAAIDAGGMFVYTKPIV